MDMQELKKQDIKGKIDIDILLFIYLVYIICVITGNFLNYTIFLLKAKVIFDFVLLVPLLFIIYYLSFKRFFNLTKPKLNTISIFSILFIGAVTFLSLPFPDAFYDTLYYHIFLQYPNFIQSVSQDYFPGGLGTYLFSLPDRMFYIFNLALGYRAGTILNPLIILIVYFQIINIIEMYFSKNNLQVSKKALALFSLGIISTEYIIANFTIYATDLFALPILLEHLRIAVFKQSYRKMLSFYIALLFGITVALKLSFLIFSLPLVVLYLINYRKDIKPLEYLIAPFITIVPVVVYLIYNYINTGNPVFPFYNEIFKSPYFPLNNLKQTAFGPQNFFEYLTWPIYILFHPERLVELSKYAGRMSIGYIIGIWSLICCIIDKRFKNSKHLCIFTSIFLLLTLFWEYTSGYARYGLFLEILAGIIILILAWHYLASGAKYKKFLGYFIIGLLIAQVFTSYYFIIIKNVNWAGKPSAIQANKTYLENLTLLGRDRINPSDYKFLDNVEAWVITNYNSGYAVSLKNNIPILHLKLWWINSVTPRKAVEDYNNLVNKLKGKRMFTLASLGQVDNTLMVLKQNGFKMVDTKMINHPFLLKDQKLYLIEIKSTRGVEVNSQDKSNNLLADGSFENVANGEEEKWNISNVNDQLISSNDAQEGKYYVRASVDKPITQVVSIESNKLYNLSFNSRIIENDKKLTRLQVNWLKDGKFVDCSIKIVDSTKQWQKHEMQVMSPENVDTAIIYVNAHEKYFIGFDNVNFSETK